MPGILSSEVKSWDMNSLWTALSKSQISQPGFSVDLLEAHIPTVLWIYLKNRKPTLRILESTTLHLVSSQEGKVSDLSALKTGHSIRGGTLSTALSFPI